MKIIHYSVLAIAVGSATAIQGSSEMRSSAWIEGKIKEVTIYSSSSHSGPQEAISFEEFCATALDTPSIFLPDSNEIASGIRMMPEVIEGIRSLVHVFGGVENVAKVFSASFFYGDTHYPLLLIFSDERLGAYGVVGVKIDFNGLIDLPDNSLTLTIAPAQSYLDPAQAQQFILDVVREA